jgi:hypothetical protein
VAIARGEIDGVAIDLSRAVNIASTIFLGSLDSKSVAPTIATCIGVECRYGVAGGVEITYHGGVLAMGSLPLGWN